MTSQVYPTLQGLTFDVIRSYVWHTEKQVALSGKRSTLAYQQYPLVHFELTYSLLRDDITISDLKALVGLHNVCRGMYDTFLFSDPDFNTVSSSAPQTIGYGDGSTKTFQIIAQYGNAGGPYQAEAIQNFSGTPVVYINNAIASTYTLGPSGIVTFTTAPANGATVAWSGSFYYRCAFDEDTIEWTKFMTQWWSVKKIAFTSVKL